MPIRIWGMQVETCTRQTIEWPLGSKKYYRGMTQDEITTYAELGLLQKMLDDGRILQAGQSLGPHTPAFTGAHDGIAPAYTSALQDLALELARHMEMAANTSSRAKNMYDTNHKEILTPVTRKYIGSKNNYLTNFVPL